MGRIEREGAMVYNSHWEIFPFFRSTGADQLSGYQAIPIFTNATNAIVTGGVQDRSTSANTWLVDLTTTKVTPGLTMKTKRYGHGCSIFHEGTKSFGIVSGGSGFGEYLDSTEMIDLDQESPTWIEGMQAKSKIVYL